MEMQAKGKLPKQVTEASERRVRPFSTVPQRLHAGARDASTARE